MTVVIENLILKTDDRTGADRLARGFVSLRNGRLNKSFDPAIAPGGHFEIHLQLKIGIALAGDDVAAARHLSSAVRQAGADRQHTVNNLPAFLREGVGVWTAPAVSRFAIPKQAPAIGFFRRGKRVGRGVLRIHGDAENALAGG